MRTDPRRAQDAVGIYRGDLLPQDLYEAWAEWPRERARLRYLELLRMRGRWDLVLQAEPTDEDAHLHLARDMLARGEVFVVRLVHVPEDGDVSHCGIFAEDPEC